MRVEPTPHVRPDRSPRRRRGVDRAPPTAPARAERASSTGGREAPELSAVRRRIMERPVQERSRLRPISTHRSRGDAKTLGCFLFRHTAEESTLDHPRQTLVELGEVGERFIQLEQRLRIVVAVDEVFVERDRPLVAAALFGGATACAVDEDVPHGDRGDAEEVRAVLPLGVFRARELEVDLVHEPGRRERVARPDSELASRSAAELFVNERENFVERFGAPGAELIPKLGNGRGRRPRGLLRPDHGIVYPKVDNRTPPRRPRRLVIATVLYVGTRKPSRTFPPG